jgi:hypothetical protein
LQRRLPLFLHRAATKDSRPAELVTRHFARRGVREDLNHDVVDRTMPDNESHNVGI